MFLKHDGVQQLFMKCIAVLQEWVLLSAAWLFNHNML